MKFDPDLMRAILLDAETIPAGQSVAGFEYAEREQKEVNRHTQILIDEGYLEGSWKGDSKNFPALFYITDLTYQGHQFLANARNQTVWSRALNIAKEKGLETSISAISAILLKVATSYGVEGA